MASEIRWSNGDVETKRDGRNWREAAKMALFLADDVVIIAIVAYVLYRIL